MALEGLKARLGKRKGDLTAALAVAAVIFVMYIVVSLIIWNELSISYALIYAFVLSLMYFIFRRLLGRLIRYIMARGKA
jgi:hypothetical protein